MAIQLPRLDDRSYEQLVEAMRRQIPEQEWTDHNPSDPGIMLIELLAWLGEMLLWRTDRVPQSHRDKFLDFLLDAPEPVTVMLGFTATFPAAPGAGTITIPAGTLAATDFVSGRRFVFETYEPLVIERPPLPTSPVAGGSVRARAILDVLLEPLGVSDATPHQIFHLRPPRQALGIADDTPAPVLTDFIHGTATYEPNPRVRVAGTAWAPVASLLTPASRVSAPGAGRRYQVSASESSVRFGDDTFGAIPPAGAVIECERYAILDGTAALGVRSGDVKHLLNVTPPAGVTLALTNSDAEGGDSFFPTSTRAARGLAALRAPYRLVTERDFERAVRVDFNEFQDRSGATPKILRASVAIDKRPSGSALGDPLVDAPSHVSYVLLPGAPQFDEAQFQNEAVSVAAKQAMVGIPATLWERIRRFLHPRRLITTRLDLHTPVLRSFTITVAVVVTAGRSVADVQGDLRSRIYEFLSLVGGDVERRGWRLGRNVYRSQIFRLLEEAPGVDHVESLALAPADADGNVAIAPHELPLLQALSLTTRAV